MRRYVHITPFLLLLPLAFAAHGLSVQYGRATVGDALAVAGIVAGVLLIVTLVLRPLLRSWTAAALAAAIAGVMGLYWSYPYLRLKAAFGQALLARLPVLLAAAAGIWLVVAGLFRRAKPDAQRRWVLFFNLLFGVLFVVDGTTAAIRYQRAARAIPPAFAAPVTNHPPVFVLLFDEYGSPASLRRRGIAVDGVDSFLRNRGFFVPSRAKAAYPITHFSVAALLNGVYLPLAAEQPVTLRDYNDALVWTRQARLVAAFQKAGYALRNRSAFRLGSTPPFEGRSPVVEGKTVLLAGTLWGEVIRPLWLKRISSKRLEADYFDGIRRNAALVKVIAKDAREKGPVFSYAHFFLPHAPFLYDSIGRRLPFAAALQQSAANDPEGYAANLRVATRLLKQCVATIRQQRPDAILLVLGDHGYRNEHLPGNDTARAQPLCAIYYPDRKYTGWSDSTGLVNAFRLLTGKALGIHLPLLPERCLYLQDATGLDW